MFAYHVRFLSNRNIIPLRTEALACIVVVYNKPMCAQTLLIVPAFNEEASIVSTIEALRPYAGDFDYLIVDDGSSDATSRLCEEHGYPHVTHVTNLGLAGAFRTGIKYAERHGYEYAVQFDADGQHDPRYIADLVAAAHGTGADIVIGSRFVDEEKPFTARMAGSALITGIVKLTTGQVIHDPTSGMRLYGRRVIEVFAHGFDITPEPDTLALLMRKGFSCVEVPVVMHERTAGKSYLTFSRSISYMARMCVSILFAQWYRSF